MPDEDGARDAKSVEDEGNGVDKEIARICDPWRLTESVTRKVHDDDAMVFRERFGLP